MTIYDQACSLWPEAYFSTALSIFAQMRKQIHSARDFILPVIDFFYPAFKKLMSLQTFRYAASGGGNTLLGLIIYTISFKYIFREQTFDLGFYAMKEHVAALAVTFLFTFPVGFFMSKYIVFSDSDMKGRIQLFRYFMVCTFNLLMNYILLKIMVERFYIYPVLAQLFTICLVVIFSYLAQKNYSFKVEETE